MDINLTFVVQGFAFFAVAWILMKWGAPAKLFIDKYFNLLSIIFVLLLIGGFAAIAMMM